MNFNYGSSSHTSSFSVSSSSSDDDYDNVIQNQVVSQITTNNNFIISQNQFHYEGFHVGSISGHQVINRNRENASHNLFNDYFADNPLFPETMFGRRFWMSRPLFLRIYDAVKRHDNYFVQRRDGVGKLGLSGLQKITAVFRMLAYRSPTDSTDEYIQIGESTAIESLKRFCHVVIEVFGSHYLRSPNVNDVAWLLHIGESRGFPGMLGSLDCMHWKWNPTAWGGQYAGRSGSPTIILEAVANHDLWIWHAFFGLSRSNNDINVLEVSHLFANLAEGIAPSANYVINGKNYDMAYYLTDGIYPKWSTLVQTIHDPRGPKKKLFAKKQESCRKDVKRAFGVLQSRFAIVVRPSRFWNKHVLHDIMTTCIIMHNMIIEDERDVDAIIDEQVEFPTIEVEIAGDDDARFQEFLACHRKIKDQEAHIELQNALIGHIWSAYTNSENL